MGDVIMPGLPDVNSKLLSEDPQLKELLVAIKITLDKLTGADINSNSALVDLLNDNQ